MCQKFQRCNVFNNSNDKDMFLQIINKTATIHKVTLHDYCLMDNHYYLLIEILPLVCNLLEKQEVKVILSIIK
ncbi:MAG: REP element-mobilizing transposase RayT [Sulfurimonas sp.]|jgi:REP element-mobilizing transposase RayT|uniref:transposase n=1 Tax=Sulfurimonas sp. TaxID=2022749 RepID=UPI0039E2D416